MPRLVAAGGNAPPMCNAALAVAAVDRAALLRRIAAPLLRRIAVRLRLIAVRLRLIAVASPVALPSEVLPVTDPAARTSAVARPVALPSEVLPVTDPAARTSAVASPVARIPAVGDPTVRRRTSMRMDLSRVTGIRNGTRTTTTGAADSMARHGAA